MTRSLWTVWHPGSGEDGPQDGQTFSVRAQTSRSYYATELTTP